MEVLDLIGGFLRLYKIVPPDEAHVRVLFNKKEVFMSRKDSRPSYWVIPFVTKLYKLPLTNIRIDVPDVKLNDKDMAKFMCDIVCFVNIADPMLAAERTGITTEAARYEDGIESLSNDFRAIMESIGRTVATKQTILEVYQDRSKLDESVTKEVDKVFPQWGLALVDLEIKDLKDAAGSTIITDIEKKKAAEINADARVKIAEQTKRAIISESDNQKEAELTKAKNEEEWRKRQIEKDRTILVAEQDKLKTEAEKTKEANIARIEADRKLTVGQAEIQKEKIAQDAEATKIKLEREAAGAAAKITLEGEANAAIILKTKTAEAEGTQKLAEAQQKFNDAATQIEVIKANRDVQLKYAEAYRQAFEKATVNVVAGSASEIISGGLIGNVKVGPKEGIALQQFAAQNPELVAKLLEGKSPELVRKILEGLGEKK